MMDGRLGGWFALPHMVTVGAVEEIDTIFERNAVDVVEPHAVPPCEISHPSPSLISPTAVNAFCASCRHAAAVVMWNSIGCVVTGRPPG